jgi:thiol-disulfide isomerase/thioredoxin
MSKQLMGGMLWWVRSAGKMLRLATFQKSIHHLNMCLRILLVSILLTVSAWAGIVDDVRLALAQKSFSAAESALNSYRGQQGVTAEYLEAYSWLGRGALEQRQYGQAAAYAKQTQSLALEQLKNRPLDAEPHLPIALGAALEVQAQVLAARGQRTQAVALLQSALRTYGRTSIQARLQKNLNLLSLQGKLAPPLKSEEFLGAKLPLPAQLKGSPVLLFFWAHWCSDCKGEAPLIADLQRIYGPKGLALIGPTKFYGYAANGEDAAPAVEKPYIDKIRLQFYGMLPHMPAPLSAANFQAYGASTVPTIVLVDAAGIVRLYHPGVMPEAELSARIQAVLRK